MESKRRKQLTEKMDKSENNKINTIIIFVLTYYERNLINSGYSQTDDHSGSRPPPEIHSASR